MDGTTLPFPSCPRSSKPASPSFKGTPVTSRLSPNGWGCGGSPAWQTRVCFGSGEEHEGESHVSEALGEMWVREGTGW